MNCIIKVFTDGLCQEYEVDANSNLLSSLTNQGYLLRNNCAGNGTCGKCKVGIIEGILQPPSSDETTLLGESNIEKGYRLACSVTVQSDITLELPHSPQTTKIVTEGRHVDFSLSPYITKMFVTLQKPSLEDQRSDAQRIKDAVSSIKPLGLSLMSNLPEILRKSEYKVTVVLKGNAVLAVENGDTTKNFCGLAVDIGTTTIAAYLVNLGSGELLSTYSALNPQRSISADVIGRIKYSFSEPDGLLILQKSIVGAVNDAITIMTNQASFHRSDIYHIVFTGNTTMLHFLLGIYAFNISVAPFIPVFTDKVELLASLIGIDINQNAIVTTLPPVSAYIGADTVSAVLASGLDFSLDNVLLIDFGTNGEMVLAVEGRLFACSAAAGPAFEGASITCGIGSVSGAIDSFSLSDDLSYTTIDNKPANGICGTGLVDIVAAFLKIGIIDETGRFSAPSSDNRFADRFIDYNGQAAFLLARKNETESGEDIFITQRDIRELQNAKAAITAGIQVLLKRACTNFDNLSYIYLAGGFGTYINAQSAKNIGLIPAHYKGKMESIGNAAGQGALMCLLSREALHKTEIIKSGTEYVELSSDKDFSEFFIEAMMFPE